MATTITPPPRMSTEVPKRCTASTMIHADTPTRMRPLTWAASTSARLRPKLWREVAGRPRSAMATSEMDRPMTSEAMWAASASRASELNSSPPTISATRKAALAVRAMVSARRCAGRSAPFPLDPGPC